MRVINFQDAHCAHCYKCLRNCQMKAIRIKDGQAMIVRDMCVYCGHCMEICPQQAKTFDSDLLKVKDMLKRGEKVIVSLGPSYRGVLNSGSSGQMVTALKKLGFYEVRQASEGGHIITQELVKLINEGKMDNIITSDCTSVYNLVEKHYPMLIPYLAPLVSPMIAHGKWIKKIHGDDVKVVFIGSCVAKKMEAEVDKHTVGVIDAVIEFRELEQWLNEEGIVIADCEVAPFDNPDPKINQLYPVPNGILRAVDAYGADPKKYKRLTVSDVASVREFFHSMKNGDIHNCFAEVHLCAGGCVNGPGIEKDRGLRFKIAMHLEDHTTPEKADMDIELSSEELHRNFVPKQVVEKLPSEEDIKRIMKSIGKSDSDVEFNCGACGYLTCRDNAIAIFHGKAEADMCIIRNYENARSQANTVLRTTPNIIVIADGNMKIKEFNKKAEQVFGISRPEALRTHLFELIPTTEFERVHKTHENVLRQKAYWETYQMHVLQTIVYVPEHDTILTIIEDVTEEALMEEKRMLRKLHTIEMAQSVIEHQMKTAQEIAGLLGETTAETKAILTRVRDYVLEEEV